MCSVQPASRDLLQDQSAWWDQPCEFLHSKAHLGFQLQSFLLLLLYTPRAAELHASCFFLMCCEKGKIQGQAFLVQHALVLHMDTRVLIVWSGWDAYIELTCKRLCFKTSCPFDCSSKPEWHPNIWSQDSTRFGIFAHLLSCVSCTSYVHCLFSNLIGHTCARRRSPYWRCTSPSNSWTECQWRRCCRSCRSKK